MAHRCEQCRSLSENPSLCPLCGVPMREQVDVKIPVREEGTAEEDFTTGGTEAEA